MMSEGAFDKLVKMGERLLPSANSIDEVLDFDAIDYAEKMTGEDHGGNTSILFHLAACQRRKEVLEGFNDTTLSMKAEDYIARIEEINFKKILEAPFHCSHHGREQDEMLFLFWHQDGLLLRMDTYGEDRNSAEVYFNYKPNDRLKAWEGLSHVSGGFDESYIMSGWVDAREGIKHRLQTISAHGKFLNPWKRQMHLWLLNYCESHEKIEFPDVINHKRITLLPKEIQEAIKGE